MTETLLVELTIFVLAVFVGFEVVSKVPSMLHTPLMSATNAIHGIVVVGAMLIAGSAIGGTVGQAIGLAAMILATINVVGGFAVTGRMLQMFKAKAGPKA
jgi:NAD(P) transhydrogenase subunit alpha